MLLTIAALVSAAADKPTEPDRKVCRRVATTGSLFAARVCRTRAEWDAADAARKSDADRLRDAAQRGENRPG